jgi:hypothetical protein
MQAMFGLLMRMLRPFRVSAQVPLPERTDCNYDAVEMAAIEAGLELERRLYESVQASVETTFAKEGLLAIFLTSGGLVAVASALQAIAQLAHQLSPKGALSACSLLILSVAFIIVSFFSVVRLFQGQKVKDLTAAEEYVRLALASGEPTRRDVVLQLSSEYTKARERLQVLVDSRYRQLTISMVPIGVAVASALLAALVAVLDVSHFPWRSNSRQSASETTYNNHMRRPIIYPQAGSGTTLTKGGGGTPPAQARPSEAAIKGRPKPSNK